MRYATVMATWFNVVRTPRDTERQESDIEAQEKGSSVEMTLILKLIAGSLSQG